MVFARDKMFIASPPSAGSVILSLQDDVQTLAVFPFQFIFRVEYIVSDRILSCIYHVENKGADTMYFSVGGHPAFNLPLMPDLQYTDYLLEFNKDEILQSYLLQNGLTNDTTEEVQLVNKTLSLKPELFFKDAIVLKHINSSEITLRSNMDEHGLKFMFDDFHFFGIWAAKNAPFVCLEPWCGIADNINHDYQLIHKEGIIKLTEGESWKRSWSAEMF